MVMAMSDERLQALAMIMCCICALALIVGSVILAIVAR